MESMYNKVVLVKKLYDYMVFINPQKHDNLIKTMYNKLDHLEDTINNHSLQYLMNISKSRSRK